MQKLEIKGGRKISGTITISGSKNSTLPILAATILTNKKVTIKNIPIVKDVITMMELLSTIGSSIKFDKKNYQEALEFMQDEKRCLLHKENNRYLGFVSMFSWKTHQKTWIKNKLFPVLTIRYEDLQAYLTCFLY